jgi:hypothetical protein
VPAPPPDLLSSLVSALPAPGTGAGNFTQFKEALSRLPKEALAGKTVVVLAVPDDVIEESKAPLDVRKHIIEMAALKAGTHRSLAGTPITVIDDSNGVLVLTDFGRTRDFPRGEYTKIAHVGFGFRTTPDRRRLALYPQWNAGRRVASEPRNRRVKVLARM